MERDGIPGLLKAVYQSGLWQIQDEAGHTIAKIENIKNAKAYARMIAASPYMLEALEGVVRLIGDEDLEDNGEFSGAAISDMVRTAVELARGTQR